MQKNDHMSTIREVYFGFVRQAPKSIVGPRIQRGIEFVYVIAGKVDILVNGETFTLTPGHMALQLPGRQEQYNFDSDQLTEQSWCQLDFDLPPTELLSLLYTLPRVLPVTQEVEQLLDLGLNITNTKTVNNHPILHHLGEALLKYYQEIATLTEEQRPQPASRIVRKARLFMQQNYADNITLKALANASHCSMNHLINQFKASFDMTPIRYLWQFRLDRSESLLRHTDASIATIAEQCGFTSPFHFSRLFKQRHQLSPSQYRQKKSNSV